MEQEVNLNDPRLQAILGKSKAVMNKTDAQFGQVKQSKISESTRGMNDRDDEHYEKEMPMMQHAPRNEAPINPNNPQYKARLETSGMPDVIKQSLMNNPLSNEPMMVESNQPQQTPQPQQQYAPQQQYLPNQPGITREDVKNLVKEVLAEMMVKTISENSIKTTIRTLINEGKIRPKKKV